MSDTALRYTVPIKLEVNTDQAKWLLVVLECARQMYNCYLSEALKRYKQICRTKLYKETLKLSKTNKEEKKERNENFEYLNNKFGFTKDSMSLFATKARNTCPVNKEYLGSTISHKLSERAFKTVVKLQLKKIKKVHYKSKGNFVSFEGKNNYANIIYKEGYVRMNRSRIELKCLIDPKDKWLEHALNCKIKFCRIICKQEKGKKVFYLQLILEGQPYKKYELGKGRAAIDTGIGTYAFSNENFAFVKPLFDDINQHEKNIIKLEKLQGRRRKQSNPNNYNEDGTIKGGKRLWNDSNRYMKTKDQIAELERVFVAKRNESHGFDSNLIISKCSHLSSEDLSYKELQKNYGRSVRRHAPGRFFRKLTKKVELYGGKVQKICTYKTRLSQTCQCGKVRKKSLSKRLHKCSCGVSAHRDIYSAYLAIHVNENNELDLNAAQKMWPEINILSLKEVEGLKESMKLKSNDV